jgi:hypothetical protein
MDSSQALLAEQSDDEGEEVNAALLHARALAKSPDAESAAGGTVGSSFSRRKHRTRSRRIGLVFHMI